MHASLRLPTPQTKPVGLVRCSGLRQRGRARLWEQVKTTVQQHRLLWYIPPSYLLLPRPRPSAPHRRHCRLHPQAKKDKLEGQPLPQSQGGSRRAGYSGIAQGTAVSGKRTKILQRGI